MPLFRNLQTPDDLLQAPCNNAEDLGFESGDGANSPLAVQDRLLL